MADQLEVLHSFEKLSATVQTYITEFRGWRFCHIREFIEPRDQPGAPVNTTKAESASRSAIWTRLEAAGAGFRGAQNTASRAAISSLVSKSQRSSGKVLDAQAESLAEHAAA